MTARERIETMVLRQQAVEACDQEDWLMALVPSRRDEPRRVQAWSAPGKCEAMGEGPTEADALRALLRDMGVEPWEWPATGCGALIGTPGRETTCGKGGICMGCWRIDNDPTLSMLGIGGES